MIKKALTLGILVLILAATTAPSVVSAATCAGGEAVGTQCTNGSGQTCTVVPQGDSVGYNCGGTTASTPNGSGQPWYLWIFEYAIKFIGYLVQVLAAFILTIAGYLFDTAVNFSIKEMSTNIGTGTSMGTGITEAWSTLRDIANLCFIFVLLYTAFKAMFLSEYGNVGKTIMTIVVVALLINFSLFFTKVVIDSSNIVALGFYQSIASQGTTAVPGAATTISGISSGYAKMLGLQSLYSPNILSAGGSIQSIFVTSFMGAVFMLIASIVLLVSAIMFIARFVMLIFVMVLSPLAFIAYIMPGMKNKFDDWKNMLINQSFFAPIFFALTWVAFKIGSSIKGLPGLNIAGSTFTDITTNPGGAMGLVLNFTLIIGFSIAALVMAKQMASKAAGFSAITGAMGIDRVTGVVGGASFGSAAAIGRRTIGAGASRLAQSQTLNNWAGRSWIGEKVKSGTEKVAKSSFDVRQTATGKTALQATQLGDFGTGKAGGYDATLQTQIAKKEKVAAGLKTDAAKQAYAGRTMGATGTLGPLTSWYKQGGSRAGHAQSLFGTIGRSDRIVASRILYSQIQPLQTQLSNLQNNMQNLQNRDSQLNQQLNTAQGNLIVLQNIPVANRPANYQQQLNNLQQNITNTQNQINQSQQNMQNTQNQINAVQPMVQNINNQINNLGLTNTAQANPVQLTPQQLVANAAAQAAGQALPHPPRGQRADEQNF